MILLEDQANGHEGINNFELLPIRKLNLYLGFTPAKRANPIRLVMNLRVPLRLTQRLVQRVWRLYYRVVNQRLHRL